MRSAVALACAAALVVPATAQAHSTCPMDVPTAAQVGREDILTITLKRVGGGKVLVVEGAIDADAAHTLDHALQVNKDVAEIWLRSPGGNADAGNAAGKVLRASGIPVRIPSGWWCISACNFLFFGGALRRIDPGGVFAVHMATVVNDENYQRKVDSLAKSGASNQILGEIAREEQSMARLTADDVDVILRMGISRKLLSEVMYAQRADQFRDTRSGVDARAETYRCLTREEMTRYNVVNVD